MGGVSLEQLTPSIPAFDNFPPPQTDYGENQFGQTSHEFDDTSFMVSFEPFANVGPESASDFAQVQELDMPSASVTDPLGALMLSSDTNPSLTGSSTPVIHEPEIPLIKVISVCHQVAVMLGCATEVWDQSFRWTLDPLACSALPVAFQPTSAQIRIPHHPLLDLIPFSSIRSKLICVLAMPQHIRPPNAKGNMALMDIVSDMEDDVEGFRISGSDGYREEDWEVGGAFAKKWWWCLDRKTVKRTNEWRMQRGAGRLLESSD